jgi:hypothetical protein
LSHALSTPHRFDEELEAPTPEVSERDDCKLHQHHHDLFYVVLLVLTKHETVRQEIF